MTRCGFIALLGAPNAGKSTLLNALTGSKVSIVSPKVQTTRNRILGIALENEAQLVFMDTPGIFQKPPSAFERSMVSSAWSAGGDADVVLLIVDASLKNQDQTLSILEKLSHPRVCLVLNKVDKTEPSRLLSLSQMLHEKVAFERVFMISALTGNGVADIRTFLASRMPEGPWHFPEDQLSDLPERLLAAEITREQLFLSLYDELPYSVHVETEGWENFKNGAVKISQVIMVERESQKPIILGKGGQMLKRLGERARKNIKEALGRDVHLFLTVKIQENWKVDPHTYAILGLERKK